MRSFFIICIIAFLFSCNSSTRKKADEGSIQPKPAIISPVALTAQQIPLSIKVKGKILEAWQWTDILGENILINSLVGPYDDKEKNENGEAGQSAELHAAHYVKKDSSYQLIWQIDDGEKSCPFDITCSFIKGATTITDLDKDGVAETTIQFRLACRSDVSPAEMALIMHEDTTRYYLLGQCWVKSSPEDQFTVTEKNVNLETLPGYKKTEEEYLKTFGRYESEKGFAGAPAEFLVYARRQWIKFAIESFE